MCEGILGRKASTKNYYWFGITKHKRLGECDGHKDRQES